MVLLQVRRRRNSPTEKNQRITILHIAAAITLTALIAAVFMYFSCRSGATDSINKIKLKSTNKTEETSPNSFKQKNVIKPASKSSGKNCRN